MKIIGTVAFVTGGARGIGRAICEALLKEGAKVCFVDHDGETGDNTEKDLKVAFPGSDVLFLKCDVTRHGGLTGAYKAAESRFGKIEIHVNNAGIISESNWSRMIDVNFKGTVEGTYLALEHMRKDKGGLGGLVINIASINAFQPLLYLPVYSSTKAAVVSFTLAWAEDDHFSDHGVRLNVICPHAVDTDLALDGKAEAYKRDKFVALCEATTWLPPSRVADVVLQIIKNDEENGQILVVTPEGVHHHRMAKVENLGAFEVNKTS